MKKYICLIIAFLIGVLSMSGCAEKLPDNGKINIVTTVFPPYDFAKAIAGDKAEVKQLVRPGSESHSFEPTPDDVMLAQDCDLFLMIGLESENWAQRINQSADNKQRKTLILSDYVTLLEGGSGEHHDEEEHAGHNHSHNHEHDEHIWTSPLNAIKMSEAILNALCEIDKENEAYYKANFNTLKGQLLKLDASLRELSKASYGKTLVFGDRFPFLYLAEEYGFDYIAAFPGCAEQTEPNIKTLVELIERIKKEKISTVFYTEFSSAQTANMLCEETGATPMLLHSCHNRTKEEANSGETYLSLMKRNIENLKKAIK